jgi:drug/metabolite transporter (DMT)-like permease
MAPPVYAVLRDWRSLVRGPGETAVAAGGGIVSLVAYGIVIFAMSLGPMGSVSALRETSVVFAALIGRFFLHERLTAWRIGACCEVALGAILISHHDGARRTASTVPNAAQGHPPTR